MIIEQERREIEIESLERHDSFIRVESSEIPGRVDAIEGMFVCAM